MPADKRVKVYPNPEWMIGRGCLDSYQRLSSKLTYALSTLTTPLPNPQLNKSVSGLSPRDPANWESFLDVTRASVEVLIGERAPD